MEQQNRQPGSPIGPEATMNPDEQKKQARHGIFNGVMGRMLRKAGLIRHGRTFGPEPGTVVQRGGLVTTQEALDAQPKQSPGEQKAAYMPTVTDAGFGVSTPVTLRESGATATSSEAQTVLRGGTVTTVGEAARLDASSDPYPSAREGQSQPFTGGSEAPQLTEDQWRQAAGPVGPNSVTPPQPPASPQFGNGAVHNLPLDGQPRR